MPGNLTIEQAQAAFGTIATCGNEIAFRWLAEGCECRAQFMIERLQSLGIEPGRAWALSVDRLLTVTDPSNTRRAYRWNNHVAPTVAVDGVEHGTLVIDPSLSATGPITITEWAGVMKARAIEVSRVGLPEEEILNLQRTWALENRSLDAVVFLLPLGEPPIPNRGGTGFVIGPDPPEGAEAYARLMMTRLLELQKRKWPGLP